MTSHITLAQEKKLSVKTIHEQAIQQLNQTYFLDVFKNTQDQKWQGAIWKKEDCTSCRRDTCAKCVHPVLILEDKFTSPAGAAAFLNESIHLLVLTSRQEKETGLKTIDLPWLKKIKIAPNTQLDRAKAFQHQQHGRTLY